MLIAYFVIGFCFNKIHNTIEVINHDVNQKEDLNKPLKTPTDKQSLSTSTPEVAGISNTINESVSIPVLMYHYIRDYNNPKDKVGTNLSVSLEKFEEQLKWLKDHNYQTVDFDDLNDFDQKTLTQTSYSKLIILTFDDGYLDTYTDAFPLLKKYGFTATFYIITNKVGEDNYMNWQQILDLKNAGMNIGSHTLSHPDLSKASDNRMEKEISESKKILEEKIGVTISDFCYPSGKYDNRTIELLKKYGYKTAVITKSGIFDSKKSNLLEIPRYRITNQTELNKILH